MQNVRNEEAVRLMDNWSPHLTPVVIDLLSEACVRIVTFATHTTQILQALDFTLFGALKRRGQSQLPFGDDAGRAHFIKKPYHDLRSTMSDIQIWRAFRGIGLISNISKPTTVKPMIGIPLSKVWDLTYFQNHHSILFQKYDNFAECMWSG
jgi:hypothetical protein